jgi:hypothetical protein
VVVNLCLDRRKSARARRRVAEPSSRSETSPARRRRLVERFLAAAQQGDLRGLEQVLAEDVTVWSDGGGRVSAARRPVVGRARVAPFVLGIAGRARREPGLLLGFEEADGRIRAIRAVLNPAELAFAERQTRQAVTR